MTEVRLSGIRKRYGSVEIIPDLDLEIEDGEFVVLVGPSGCGKSTLLRMIAGLEEITAGDLKIAGRRVNELSPRERNIAMVFQNYALYPHMNVRENMAFSLKLVKADKATIDQQIGKASAILGLDPLLDRLPRQLSGGQRQRVAWAAPSCAIRRYSCSTNRCPISTPSCVCRCAPKSAACMTG